MLSFKFIDFVFTVCIAEHHDTMLTTVSLLFPIPSIKMDAFVDTPTDVSLLYTFVLGHDGEDYSDDELMEYDSNGTFSNESVEIKNVVQTLVNPHDVGPHSQLFTNIKDTKYDGSKSISQFHITKFSPLRDRSTSSDLNTPKTNASLCQNSISTQLLDNEKDSELSCKKESTYSLLQVDEYDSFHPIASKDKAATNKQIAIINSCTKLISEDVTSEGIQISNVMNGGSPLHNMAMSDTQTLTVSTNDQNTMCDISPSNREKLHSSNCHENHKTCSDFQDKSIPKYTSLNQNLFTNFENSQMLVNELSHSKQTYISDSVKDSKIVVIKTPLKDIICESYLPSNTNVNSPSAPDIIYSPGMLTSLLEKKALKVKTKEHHNLFCNLENNFAASNSSRTKSTTTNTDAHHSSPNVQHLITECVSNVTCKAINFKSPNLTSQHMQIKFNVDVESHKNALEYSNNNCLDKTNGFVITSKERELTSKQTKGLPVLSENSSDIEKNACDMVKSPCLDIEGTVGRSLESESRESEKAFKSPQFQKSYNDKESKRDNTSHSLQDKIASKVSREQDRNIFYNIQNEISHEASSLETKSRYSTECTRLSGSQLPHTGHEVDKAIPSADNENVFSVHGSPLHSISTTYSGGNHIADGTIDNFKLRDKHLNKRVNKSTDNCESFERSRPSKNNCYKTNVNECDSFYYAPNTSSLKTTVDCNDDVICNKAHGTDFAHIFPLDPTQRKIKHGETPKGSDSDKSVRSHQSKSKKPRLHSRVHSSTAHTSDKKNRQRSYRKKICKIIPTSDLMIVDWSSSSWPVQAQNYHEKQDQYDSLRKNGPLKMSFCHISYTRPVKISLSKSNFNYNGRSAANDPRTVGLFHSESKSPSDTIPEPAFNTKTGQNETSIHVQNNANAKLREGIFSTLLSICSKISRPNINNTIGHVISGLQNGTKTPEESHLSPTNELFSKCAVTTESQGIETKIETLTILSPDNKEIQRSTEANVDIQINKKDSYDSDFKHARNSPDATSEIKNAYCKHEEYCSNNAPKRPPPTNQNHPNKIAKMSLSPHSDMSSGSCIVKEEINKSQYCSGTNTLAIQAKNPLEKKYSDELIMKPRICKRDRRNKLDYHLCSSCMIDTSVVHLQPPTIQQKSTSCIRCSRALKQKEFSCKFCSQCFPNLMTYAGHVYNLATYHSYLKDRYDFTCSRCKQSFKSRFSFHTHLARSKCTRMCFFCDQMFPSREAVISHVCDAEEADQFLI